MTLLISKTIKSFRVMTLLQDDKIISEIIDLAPTTNVIVVYNTLQDLQKWAHLVDHVHQPANRYMYKQI